MSNPIYSVEYCLADGSPWWTNEFDDKTWTKRPRLDQVMAQFVKKHGDPRITMFVLSDTVNGELGRWEKVDSKPPKWIWVDIKEYKEGLL